MMEICTLRVLNPHCPPHLSKASLSFLGNINRSLFPWLLGSPVYQHGLKHVAQKGEKYSAAFYVVPL